MKTLASLVNHEKEKPHSGVGSSFIEIFAVDGTYHTIVKEQSSTFINPNPPSEEDTPPPLLTEKEIAFQHDALDSDAQKKSKKQNIKQIKEKKKKATYILGSSLIIIAFGSGLILKTEKKPNLYKENLAELKSETKNEAFSNSKSNVTNIDNKNSKAPAFKNHKQEEIKTFSKPQVIPKNNDIQYELPSNSESLSASLSNQNTASSANAVTIEANAEILEEELMRQLENEIENDEAFRKIIDGDDFEFPGIDNQ